MALADISQERTRVMGRANSGERSYLSAYDNEHVQQYNRFADEARQRGITDPVAIDNYASAMNRQYWSDQSNTGQTWLEQHPWMAPLGVLGAGYGAAVLGGSALAGGAAESTAGGVAGGVGEGSLSTAATGIAPASTQGIVDGGGAEFSTGAATDVSAPLDATQDPLGSGGDPGNAVTRASGRTGAGTAMSRILDGTASTADWLSVGGNLASTGLGIAGSRNAANAYNNLAGQYMAFGAPSRARYEASMTPGFDPNSIPGYAGAVDTASKGILARLAATAGNPWGNPGGLIEANKQIISGTALPAIDAYQRLNAGTGGYAGFNAAAPAAATAGIGAQGGVYNAVGSGLAGLLNPQPSLYDTLRGLGIKGLS